MLRGEKKSYKKVSKKKNKQKKQTPFCLLINFFDDLFTLTMKGLKIRDERLSPEEELQGR